MSYLQRAREAGEVVTGLLYVHADAADLHDALNTVAAPLNALDDADLVPGQRGAGDDQRVAALKAIPDRALDESVAVESVRGTGTLRCGVAPLRLTNRRCLPCR